MMSANELSQAERLVEGLPSCRKSSYNQSDSYSEPNLILLRFGSYFRTKPSPPLPFRDNIVIFSQKTMLPDSVSSTHPAGSHLSDTRIVGTNLILALFSESFLSPSHLLVIDDATVHVTVIHPQVPSALLPPSFVHFPLW